MTYPAPTFSLRRRLIIQLLFVAAILSFLLYFTILTVANNAAEATQDNIIGASAISIADQLSSVDGEVVVDIPYGALSMLGTITQDRVFYNVIAGGESITGYEDLKLEQENLEPLGSSYRSLSYRGMDVRLAIFSRKLTIGSQPTLVSVLVAQTRQGQEAIAGKIANLAAATGIGFFIIASLLSWFAAQNALKPLRTVTDALGRRSAADLRPLKHKVPTELAPLILALNSFMDRLGLSFSRAENFLTEAAHHIRTPLATVKLRSEIALRQTDSDDVRQTLLSIIKATDESSRSASQLLDHASVAYRSDQLERVEFDLSVLCHNQISSFKPTAEMKDIGFEFSVKTQNETLMHGDPALVEMAIRNLVDNALKYSPDESKIQLNLSSSTDRITLEICDEGRGLSGTVQRELKQRFKRGSNVGDIVGSGLGLTIVDAVVSVHNGEFNIKENEEGGTCARISFPL